MTDKPDKPKHSNPAINHSYDYDFDKIIMSTQLFKDLLGRIVELERIVEILADDAMQNVSDKSK